MDDHSRYNGEDSLMMIFLLINREKPSDFTHKLKTWCRTNLYHHQTLHEEIKHPSSYQPHVRLTNQDNTLRIQRFYGQLNLTTLPLQDELLSDDKTLPASASLTYGLTKVLRHHTSNALCRFGQLSPNFKNLPNHDSSIDFWSSNGSVRIVCPIPSSTSLLSNDRQLHCSHE